MRHDPNEVLPALARALFAARAYKELLDEIWPELVSNNRSRAEILTLRALTLVALGRLQEGRQLLDRTLVEQPEFGDALVGQALLARAAKKYDEASSLVDRALADTPGNIDALLLRAELDRVLKRENPAAVYSTVIELDPTNTLARVGLSTAQIEAGDYAAARDQVKELSKLAPGKPVAKYLEASIEFRTGNLEGARSAVSEALKIAPEHVLSVRLAGEIEYALGSYDAARRYLARALDRAPQDPLVRKLLVSALARNGQIQEARRVLGHSLLLTPHGPSVLNLAGELAIQSNDMEQARRYFEQAMKIEPRNAAAHAGYAVVRMAAGETGRALADLEAAVELDATSYQVDLLLVTTHLRRARYDDALKALKSLEKKQPKNPQTYNLKAAAYLGKNDLANARRNLEYALELQPTYLSAALNLAQLDLADGNPTMARQRFETILSKDSKNIAAMLALARLHSQTGNMGKALEMAQLAQALSSESIEALEVLGALQIVGGSKRDALASYVQLAALQPKSAAALFNLANVQFLNADNAAAAETLRRALLEQPDYLKAQVALTSHHIRSGSYAEAIKMARQLQKQKDGAAVGFVLEGDVLMQKRDYPAAARAYESANRISQGGSIVMKMHSAYAQGGRPEEAEARLVQWLKTSPNDAVVRLYYGDEALKAGRYKDAIAQYEWLLQRQSNDAILLNNLAFAYQQVNDPRALSMAERAYQLKPGSPDIAETFGWLLIEQGSAERGIEVLQQAAAAAPGEPGLRYRLAQGWLKAGHQAKARNELERLLATDVKFPERQEAVDLLARLRK